MKTETLDDILERLTNEFNAENNNSSSTSSNTEQYKKIEEKYIRRTKSFNDDYNR